MLSKFITYRTLLRVVGIMFLLLATFYILRIAVRPLFGPFLGNYPENFQPQALITISFS
jgi:hypothetical protein